MNAAVIEAEAGPVGPTATPGAVGPGGVGGDGGKVSFKVCEFDDGIHPRELAFYGTPEMLDALEAGVPVRNFFLRTARRDTVELVAEIVPPEVLKQAIATDPLRRSAFLSSGILRRSCYINRVENAPRGPAGPEGDPRAADVQARQAEPPPGSAGTISHGALTFAEFAPRLDDLSLELMACAIEDQFRTQGGRPQPILRAKIEFLFEICLQDPNPSAVRKEVLARTYAMARKVALGLDFYGFSLERAPLLAFESYSRLIDTSALPQAQMIEDAFVVYWNASEEKEKQRQSVARSQGAAQAVLDNLEAEMERATEETRRHYAELPVLDQKVDAAYALLMTREEELSAAIRDLDDGCNLMGSLVAVATIVAGIASGGTGFIAAASAGAKLYGDFGGSDNSVKSLWDNRKLLGDDLKMLGEGANTVVEAIGQIRDAVAQLTPAQHRVPQFRMEREQFDKIAKEFTELPQAEAYREAGYDYLKCVETRNQAILDYNAMLVQLVEFQARRQASQRVIDGLNSVATGLSDPAEPFVMGLMNRLYLDTLGLTAQMVHAERKALAYHFARPADAPLSALNVAVIAGAHQKTLRQWADAKERFEARRELADGLLALDLRRFVTEEAWIRFKRSGVLSFTIRRDHPAYAAIFEGLPGLRLTGLTLALEGVTAAEDQNQNSLVHAACRTRSHL